METFQENQDRNEKLNQFFSKSLERDPEINKEELEKLHQKFNWTQKEEENYKKEKNSETNWSKLSFFRLI